jgi:hypothetical protein
VSLLRRKGQMCRQLRTSVDLGCEFLPLVDVGVMSSPVSVCLSMIDRDTTQRAKRRCFASKRRRIVASLARQEACRASEG